MATLQVIVDGEIHSSLELPADHRLQLHYLYRDPGSGGLALLAERPQEFVAAFLRDRRQWLVLIQPDSALMVNRRPILGLKVLDHEDELKIDGIHLRLVAMSRERLAAEASLITRRKACPVCLRRFAEGEEVVYCPNCNLAHHEACLRHLGRCASYPFDGYVFASQDSGRDSAREKAEP